MFTPSADCIYLSLKSIPKFIYSLNQMSDLEIISLDTPVGSQEDDQLFVRSSSSAIVRPVPRRRHVMTIPSSPLVVEDESDDGPVFVKETRVQPKVNDSDEVSDFTLTTSQVKSLKRQPNDTISSDGELDLDDIFEFKDSSIKRSILQERQLNLVEPVKEVKKRGVIRKQKSQSKHTSKPVQQKPVQQKPVESHSQSRPVKQKRESKPLAKPLVHPTGLSESELSSLFDHYRTHNPKLLKRVNTITHSKPELIANMIVSIDSTVAEKLRSINPDFTDFMAPLNFEFHQDTLPLILFKRHVESIYCQTHESFVPVKPHVSNEDIVAVYLPAEDLPEMFKDGSFDSTLITLLKRYSNGRIILLINDLVKYLAKVKKRLNKNYVDTVRKHIEQPEQIEQPAKKKKKVDVPEYSDEEIKSRLLQCEVEHGIHVLPLTGLRDLVDWLKSLAYTVETKYLDSLQRNDFANIGQVKCGADADSTFLEMLKQFKFMTPSSAKKLVSTTGIRSIVQLMDRVEKQELGVRSDVDATIKKVMLSTNETELL